MRKENVGMSPGHRQEGQEPGGLGHVSQESSWSALTCDLHPAPPTLFREKNRQKEAGSCPWNLWSSGEETMHAMKL